MPFVVADSTLLNGRRESVIGRLRPQTRSRFIDPKAFILATRGRGMSSSQEPVAESILAAEPAKAEAKGRPMHFKHPYPRQQLTDAQQLEMLMSGQFSR